MRFTLIRFTSIVKLVRSAAYETRRSMNYLDDNTGIKQFIINFDEVPIRFSLSREHEWNIEEGKYFFIEWIQTVYTFKFVTRYRVGNYEITYNKLHRKVQTKQSQMHNSLIGNTY